MIPLLLHPEKTFAVRKDLSSRERAPNAQTQEYNSIFAILPSGIPDAAVRPGWLDSSADTSCSGPNEYFARRIDVETDAGAIVVGIALFAKPAAGDSVIRFPEVIVAGDNGGAPFLDGSEIRLGEVTGDAWAQDLFIALDTPLSLDGATPVWLIVRFPEGCNGPKLMLDADQDFGVYPHTDYYSLDGETFTGFEDAAWRDGILWNDESLNQKYPGLAGDNLAMGVVVGFLENQTPLDPPRVNSIRRSETEPYNLIVDLEISPFYADGRQVDPSSLTNIRIFAKGRVVSYSDAVLDNGTIEVKDLGSGVFSLSFAVVDQSNGVAGIKSGVYQVLTYDRYQGNNTLDSAVLLWRDSFNRPGRETFATDTVEIASFEDFDFYLLEFLAGDSLISSFTGLGSGSYSVLDPTVALLDSNGVALASSSGRDGVLRARVPYSGDYYLLVNDLNLPPSGDEFPDPLDRFYGLSVTRVSSMGDVDSNSVFDYRDVFLIYVMVGGGASAARFTEGQYQAADLDHDGTVVGDMDDLLAALRLVGFIPDRDPEPPNKDR